MNILLVSECTHKALTETRRVIDQFAERTGQRTWQTAITLEGLKTIHYLLRKSARKNTAVACFWVRGKNRTELLWTVGRKGIFNERGRIPTNRTQRDVNPSIELSWKDGRNIEVITAISALLHDLGKMTIGFQKKLRPEGDSVDPYRHEWISLQLFLLMIKGCESDRDVLIRLSEFVFDENWYQDLKNIPFDTAQVGSLPLVRLICWLIVSHHKMPFTENHKALHHALSIDQFFDDLRAISGWVRNNSVGHSSDFCNVQDNQEIIHPEIAKEFKGWNAALCYRAQEALNLEVDKRGEDLLSPFISYLCRTALIMGDHTYSSMSAGNHLRFMHEGERVKLPLIANTHRSTREPNQPLAKHLTSVARYAASFAGKLSLLREELPALADNAQLKKRTPQKYHKFVWQDRARDLGNELSFESATKGFFGINMASTGHGKTLGNVKIMTGLNNERRRSRITIALGLRILTLQTGEKLKEDLKLSDQEIAVLVGGSGVTDLYGMKEGVDQLTDLEDQDQDILEKLGSQSLHDFIAGDVFGGYDTALKDDDFGILMEDSKACKLIYTPIISTTIDHLIPASEATRGGRQIVPLLRLLTSDLIFDEVDDFNPDDLYAVTRLIYLAGLLGSRIMLSSATLAPDLVAGLFSAYQAGYREWQKQHLPDTALKGQIICAWFDEFQQDHSIIRDLSEFEQAHQTYVQKRIIELQKMRITAPFRQGIYVPFDFSPSQRVSESDYLEFAASLLPAIKSMHLSHCEKVPYTEASHHEKTFSTGILRIANINNIIPLTKAFFELELNSGEENFELHIVPYHARQLLLLRSQLEKTLDRILNRNNAEKIFQQPEIRNAIKQSDATHHIFLIIASPVIEVGRDIDVNWAISEPSSMGSLIQLCGRILRHRNWIPETPNIGILKSNIKAKKKAHQVVYCKPGFEDNSHQLVQKEADDDFEYLFRHHEIAVIDSISRIIKEPEASISKKRTLARKKDQNQKKYRYLSTLEHAVLHDLYFTEVNGHPSLNDMNIHSVPNSAAHLHVNVQMRTRFRRSQPEIRYILFPLEEAQRRDIKTAEFKFVTYETVKERKIWFNQTIENTHEQFVSSNTMMELPVKKNPNIHPWLVMDLREEFSKTCQYFKNASPRNNAIKFLTILLDPDQQYEFNSWLGFYPKK